MSKISLIECHYCGREFESYRSHARFCCQTCRIYASRIRRGQMQPNAKPWLPLPRIRILPRIMPTRDYPNPQDSYPTYHIPKVSPPNSQNHDNA